MQLGLGDESKVDTVKGRHDGVAGDETRCCSYPEKVQTSTRVN